MTCHVLHAGDGYQYLTDQVASGDVVRGPGDELSSYYHQHGNPPGQWVGRGCGDLEVSGAVSEEQMQALFGEGLHPDANERVRQRLDAGEEIGAAINAERLGRRFKHYDQNVPLAVELRGAYGRFETEHQRRPNVAERREIKERTAYALLVAENPAGPEPTRSQVRQYIQDELGKSRQPVAGFDLVFTPVKGLSLLWGLGDDGLRSEVERIHGEAWREAVDWLEHEGAFTRAGTDGVAQLETTGLVATAFQHRDSRAGDPNLHTHVAVSNRVLSSDGVWRTLDSRQLHHVAVAASEVYNARVEDKANRELGVSFEDAPKGEGKRPVREVTGLPPEWLKGFSRRREQVEHSYDDLVADYVRQHGRTPPRTVQLALAQQATLQTRPAKSELPSLSELLQDWQQRAAQMRPDLDVAETVSQAVSRPKTVVGSEAGEPDVAAVAAEVVATVSTSRATWTGYHLRAETERQLRGYTGADPGQRAGLVEQIVARARDVESLSLEVEPDPVPPQLQRSDGGTVFRRHGMARHTSEGVLAAEDRLLQAGQRERGVGVAAPVREAALQRLQRRTEVTLNAGQRRLVEHFTGCGAALAVGIGPPGTGKSTAMRAVREAWETTGGRVVGLAPSAAAAEVLGDDLGTRAETLHRLTYQWAQGGDVAVQAGDMLLVDEAGMAGTGQLDTVRAIAEQRGAVVRLVGDYRQLTAVESGGALRLLHHDLGGVELSEVRRFHRPDEARAVLGVRLGEESVVGWYSDNGRLHGGVRAAVVDELYRDWQGDRAGGVNSVMLSDAGEVVRELSARAQTELRAAGVVEPSGVALHDDTHAGLGDCVVTRRNRRDLVTRGGRDFVKNGDLWQVLTRSEDGGLQVRHLQHAGTAWLPADYVASQVELGYASTVHRAQGMTVDRARMHLSTLATRESATVGLSRGRASNHAYLETDAVLGSDEPEVMTGDLYYGYRSRTTAEEQFAGVLWREGAELSATQQLRQAQQAPFRLDHLVPQYDYARQVHRGANAEADAEHWLRHAVPEWAEHVLGEEAWPALHAVLHDVHDTGTDPVALLARRAGERELGSADSVAQVLHYRLAADMPEPEPAPQRPGQLPGWVATPPSGEVDADRSQAEAELGAWIRARGEAIADRVVWLGEQAAAQRPAWTDRLGEVPEDPVAREIWQLRAGQVAAYRERFGVAETDTSLLGPAGRGQQHRAHAWVQEYLRRADPRTPQPVAPAVAVDAVTVDAIETAGPEAVHPETAEDVLTAARRWAAGGDEPTGPGELASRVPAPGEDSRVDRAAEVNAAAAAWFGQQLDRHEPARDYLAGRVPDSAAARAQFTVGYAPTGWRGLVEHLRTAGYADQDLLEAGVASESRNGWLIDRFRGRAMLAWYDEHGRVAGFTGRDLSGQHPAKYLNTPATRLFDKSELLFGLWEQRHNLADGATPVLVEGAFDVLALRSADPQRADVAPVTASGTAVTDRHLDTLQRTADTEQLVVGLDQDAAGQAAAATTVQRAVHRWRDTRVATLPDGYDPAEWVAAHEQPEQALSAYTDYGEHTAAATWLAHRAVDAHFAERPEREHEVEGQVAAARAAARAVAHVDLASASQAGLDVAQRLGLDPSHIAPLLGEARSSDPDAAARSGARQQAEPSPPRSVEPAEPAATPPDSAAEAAPPAQSEAHAVADRARALRERAAQGLDRSQSTDTEQNQRHRQQQPTDRREDEDRQRRTEQQRDQQRQRDRERQRHREQEHQQHRPDEQHRDRGTER